MKVPRGSKGGEVLNNTEVIRKKFMNDVKTLGVNLVTDGLNLQFKTKTNKNHTRTKRTEILKRKPGSILKRQGCLIEQRNPVQKLKCSKMGYATKEQVQISNETHI